MNKLHRRVFLDKIGMEDVKMYISFYVEASNRDAFMAVKQVRAVECRGCESSFPDTPACSDYAQSHPCNGKRGWSAVDPSPGPQTCLPVQNMVNSPMTIGDIGNISCTSFPTRAAGRIASENTHV
jgi:hypothetical protein